MKILSFDIKKGVYSFEFNDLKTEKHSHPVVEIINAVNGTFSLESNGTRNDNLVFAIICPNIEHRVVSKDCTVEILMVESNNNLLIDFLKSTGVKIEDNLFLKTYFPNRDILFTKIKKLSSALDLKTTSDERINTSIKFIEENAPDYKNLIPALTSKAYLSESRLSHLFKKHVGISIKKYLVWNKLRQAINLYLNGNHNLTEVSLRSGFFDQSHLSNSFKNILGVSPNKAYNSRTLQA